MFQVFDLMDQEEIGYGISIFLPKYSEQNAVPTYHHFTFQ